MCYNVFVNKERKCNVNKKERLTVREMILDLLNNVKAEDLDKEILSIGTWCGADRPCDYTIRLANNTEINIGKRR
jgi:hypothetical protein